ncbi:hypothetical protein ACWD5Z_31810 [Micromonospora chokoriensis]
MTLVQGVTEERAAEIAEYKARQAIEKFALEGRDIAHLRISRFDRHIVTECLQRGLLDAFGDPSFQILLNKAQLQAASVTTEGEQDLLIKLLAERAADPRKKVHLAVSRATAAVDSIDDPALVGLTVLWFQLMTETAIDDPVAGLTDRNETLGQIISGRSLPQGIDWVQDLELLNLVVADYSGSMRSFDDLAGQRRPGFFTEGFDAVAAEEVRASLQAIDPKLTDLVVPHAFSDRMFRLNLGRVESCLEVGRKLDLTEIQTQKVATLFFRHSSMANHEVRSRAMKFIESDLPHLSAARDFQNDVMGKFSVRFTPPGKALAYSEGKRHNDLDGLPSLADYLLDNY